MTDNNADETSVYSSTTTASTTISNHHKNIPIQSVDNDRSSKSSPPSSTPPRFLVYYRNVAYDITSFAHKHPGGRNTLAGLSGRDMERRLRTVPPHSPAAMYLMREYRVDNDANNNIRNNSSTATGKSDGSSDGSFNYENDSVEKEPPTTTKYRNDDTNELRLQTDESMEVGVIRIAFRDEPHIANPALNCVLITRGREFV